MIRVIATFQFAPEKRTEAVERIVELVEKTRLEKGCAGYYPIVSAEDENQVVILEAWETQEDLDTHSASEHFTRLVPLLVEACTQPPVISNYMDLD